MQIAESLKKLLDIRKTFSQKWKKCPMCGEELRIDDLPQNLYVCTKCKHHLRMPVSDRVNSLVDAGTFSELSSELESLDPIKFTDSKSYRARYEEAISKNKVTKIDGCQDIKDAIVTGYAKINGIPVLLGVMIFDFMGGSMGSVVGEKVTRLFEVGAEKSLPVIIITTSGGARMQEGMFSLMQMAKTSAAVKKFKKTGLPYISVMADPTTGGVSASFATLGDIQLAEPGALVGFAGPRVIEQTIGQKLPDGFQRSSFLLEHGMIDAIVERANLKDTLSKLLMLLGCDK